MTFSTCILALLSWPVRRSWAISFLSFVIWTFRLLRSRLIRDMARRRCVLLQNKAYQFGGKCCREHTSKTNLQFNRSLENKCCTKTRINPVTGIRISQVNSLTNILPCTKLSSTISALKLWNWLQETDLQEYEVLQGWRQHLQREGEVANFWKLHTSQDHMQIFVSTCCSLRAHFRVLAKVIKNQ